MHSRKPKPLPHLTQAITDKFWARVDKTPGQGPKGDCWCWTGATSTLGYGQVNVYGVGVFLATRFGYLIQHGKDPAELYICHECDWPPCVRGTHLRADTQAGNLGEASIKGRMAFGDRNGTRTHPESVCRGVQLPCAKFTEEEVLNMRELYARGTLINQIAAIFKASKETIRAIIRGESWTHVGGPIQTGCLIPQGEASSAARITELQVREIRAAHKSGIGSTTLAKRYPISKNSILKLLRGETWRHVK